MGWRIIEVDKNAHAKLFLNNLIISGDKNISLPINDIDVILFTNNRTNVTVNLINELTKNNICVFFCDEKYMPASMVFPIFGNLLTLKIFEKQMNWTSEYKDTLWQSIIRKKIKNQIDYLKYLNKLTFEEINELKNYWLQVNLGDTTNREGHIAKIYWNKMFGYDFSRDNDNLQINKVLNYGYTILNGMVARSIIKKGLDPRISIHHKSVYNQFALSSDLIEPFRIVIDILVKELLDKKVIENNIGIINGDVKEICLDFIANFKVMINGLYQQLNNAIDEFIDDLVSEKIFDTSLDFSFEVISDEQQELEIEDIFDLEE